MNLFNFFLRFWNKIKAMNVKLLVKSPAKILNVIWNLVTKTYPKFVTSRLFFNILKTKLKKNYADSKMNKFIWNWNKKMPYLIVYSTIIRLPIWSKLFGIIIMQNKYFWHMA